MAGKTKKIFFFSLAIITFLVVVFLLPKAVVSWRWQKAVGAAGGLPYQIGLTNAAVVKCVTTGEPPICSGGILCATLDVARCTLYSEVTGIPAGGMGKNALFSNIAIAQAGLTPGGQLIAGGMSPTFMDQGVLASAGGCYGCLAKEGIKDKIFAWLDKYIIAGFKSN